MAKMKCSTCKYKKSHFVDSRYAGAGWAYEPYNYEYCAEGHWCGDRSVPQRDDAICIKDKFVNCQGFEIIIK